MKQEIFLPAAGNADDRFDPGADDAPVFAPPPRLGEILVEEQRLSPRGLERALRFQQRQPLRVRLLRKETPQPRLGEALLRLKLVTVEDLSHALARQRWLARLSWQAKKLHPFPEPQSQPDTGVRRELIAAYRPLDTAVEAFRALRSHLLLRGFDGERKTLTVVSTGKGEGRSYVAANLAVVFAQLGKRTLLVDADLRSPRQDRIFDLPRYYGLAGVLGAPRNMEEAFAVPAVDNLRVVPAGPVPTNPLELLSKARFREWLAARAEQFEVILIDTPASARYTDTAVITALSDAALMVVRKDYTRLPGAREAVDSLTGTGVPMVGTVMNRF